MTVQQLRRFLRQLTERHFTNAEVSYTNEKRTKSTLPIVTLSLGNIQMSDHACELWRDGKSVKYHPSTAKLEVNLYTPGIPYEGSGCVVYENSACDEIAAFCHYLEYPSTQNLLTAAGVSMLPEGPIIDVTEILGDIEPEYRAMIEFAILFTQVVTDPYAQEGDCCREIDATGYFTEVEFQQITTESEENHGND
jgi:hypothetical protein